MIFFEEYGIRVSKKNNDLLLYLKDQKKPSEIVRNFFVEKKSKVKVYYSKLDDKFKTLLIKGTEDEKVFLAIIDVKNGKILGYAHEKKDAVFSTTFSRERVENELFLKAYPKVKIAYNSVVNLWNDVFTKYASSLDKYPTLSAVLFFIVQPQLYSIMGNLLLGNISGCYWSIRQILESVVEGVIAQLRFPEYPPPKCFDVLYGLKMSFRELCEKLLPAPCLGRVKDVVNLWRELSDVWVHPRGFIKRIEEEFKKRKTPPMWSMAIPYAYDLDDVDDLRELGETLQKLREIVNDLIGIFT